MKFIKYSKRILCLLLVCSMFVLACACDSEDKNKETTPEPTESETIAEETEAPLLPTDILLSGEKSFRIIYDTYLHAPFTA